MKTILTIIISLSVATGISAPATEKYADAVSAAAQTNAQKYADAMLVDYAKRTEIPSVPTKVSAFENDKGYLTGESDPTVPAWAKARTKPSYTASEVDAVPTSRKINGRSLTSDVALGANAVGAYSKGEIDLKESDIRERLRLKQDLSPATVAATEISYRADGGTISVVVADGGTLSATVSGWTDGQAQTAIILLASGATVSDGISLVGYGSWPTGRFLASCVRVGSRIYVTPITYVAEED